MTQESRPAAGLRTEIADTGGIEMQQGKRSATPRKRQRVLGWFADGKTLNRFDAYRELRDSCLNTTVSQIERRGVRVLRREETVPGAFGPVHCCRYWLSPESRDVARALLYPPEVDPSTASAGAALGLDTASRSRDHAAGGGQPCSASVGTVADLLVLAERIPDGRSQVREGDC